MSPFARPFTFETREERMARDERKRQLRISEDVERFGRRAQTWQQEKQEERGWGMQRFQQRAERFLAGLQKDRTERDVSEFQRRADEFREQQENVRKFKEKADKFIQSPEMQEKLKEPRPVPSAHPMETEEQVRMREAATEAAKARGEWRGDVGILEAAMAPFEAERRAIGKPLSGPITTGIAAPFELGERAFEAATGIRTRGVSGAIKGPISREIVSNVVVPSTFAPVLGVPKLVTKPAALAARLGRGGARGVLRRGAKEAVEEAVGDPALESAVAKMTRGLRQGKKQYVETDIERGLERGRRATEYEAAYHKGVTAGMEPGAAHRAAERELVGKYPTAAGVDIGLTEPEKMAIWGHVDTTALRPFERKNLRDLLMRLEIGAEGGAIRPFEVKLFEKAYGKPAAEAMRKAMRKEAGVWIFGYDLAVMPKAVLSAFDISYPFRQGIMLGPRHLKEFLGNIPAAIKLFGSEKHAQKTLVGLLDDAMEVPVKIRGTTHQMPLGEIRQNTGLLRTLDPALETSEEVFRSSLAERLPLIGRVVKASNRSFTMYGNKLRADVQKSIINKWVRQGVEITPERLQNLSNMLNRFTGRGTLSSSRLTQILQATWWSPQYRLSGPQALAQLVSSDGAIRREAAENLVAFLGTGFTALALAQLSGAAKVDLDPRSADFGKIQVGDTRWNYWGTQAVLARTIARVITGQRIDPNLDVVPTDRLKAVERYFMGGLAPEWSAVYEIAKRENYLGEPIDRNLETFKREAKNRLVPLAIQDIWDAIEVEGPLGAAVAPGTLLGATVQTYEPRSSQELGAIPEFEGLAPREVYEIRQFLREVDEVRDDWRARFGPPGEGFSYSDAIRHVGEQQGKGPHFIEWAIALRPGSTSRKELRNPEWVDYVVQHYPELEQQRSSIYERNYIIDALREAGVEMK